MDKDTHRLWKYCISVTCRFPHTLIGGVHTLTQFRSQNKYLHKCNFIPTEGRTMVFP